MILLQIITPDPTSKLQALKEKHRIKETHSFSEIVHDLWLNCTSVICEDFKNIF